MSCYWNCYSFCKTRYRKLTNQSWKNREQDMEADTKQQKVDNKENIQALLVVYDRPNLIRSQVGSVSTFGCMPQFRIFFSIPSKCTKQVVADVCCCCFISATIDNYSAHRIINQEHFVSSFQLLLNVHNRLLGVFFVVVVFFHICNYR